MTVPMHRRTRDVRVVGGVGVVAVSLVLVVAAAVAIGVGGLAARNPPAAAADAAARSPAHVPTTSAGAGEGRWLRVLDRLDRLRADAWRAGEPSLLGRVYLRDSVARRADVAMLKSYRSRGLSADGVRLDFASVRVVGRRPGEVTLAVIDRLRPVQVHADGGAVANLPADQPTAHRIVLREVHGRWLIAAVTARPRR